MPRRAIASGRSCLECRRRKIKCDRSFPCAYCVKVRVQCSYPPRRAERTQSRSPSSRRSESSLEARVDRIEGALEALGRDFSQIRELLLANVHRSDNLSSENGEENDQPNIPPDEDTTHHISLGLSEDLNQENCEHNATQPNDFVNEKSSKDIVLPNSAEGDTQLRSLFKSDPVPRLETLRPSPVTVSFLWQKYLENVDPLIKIFHAPTLQRQVMNLVRGRRNNGYPDECLMFAIYYSAILTMDAVGCQEELEEDKEELLNRYRTGVEKALLKADFVNTQGLSVLQALVIYLICGEGDKSSTNMRKLMDLAIGMAVKTGLHHDGESQGIAPFEVEMRRRLWWHICILDTRAAESNGSTPRILESHFDTKMPTNVSDASLDPVMKKVPQPQTGKTELLFSLIRFEVSYFGRRIVFSDQFCRDNGYKILSPLEKCKLIDEFRAGIENKYLSCCDSTVPLDFVTIASTRLILVRFKLAVTKPRAGIRQKDIAMPGNFRGICVDVLQHAQALRGYESGKQWLWLFKTYVEWEALACLLLDLCLTLSDTPDYSAWEIVEEAYSYWKQHNQMNGSGRWGKIEQLYNQGLAMRDSPEAIMPTPVSNDQDAGVLDFESSEHLTRMWEMATSAAVTVGIHTPEPVTSDEVAEMPTSGTACEWSVGVFGQYFEMMDSSPT
ncbi:hypothetical protein P170DRAFT_513118 [Aspergillus steynii IBT 23096]|uniref:Zn(2)-C6 fungal-type domain-containing protein n=1 Tax=Aspergillus steynii IBT 23096 TaxID=1392250 RepID=A0A2I2FWP2_9EURO|nr:uncharacterized protein P170DRAFT_513118 [Aspergillus steynii IBT 23096]PLB45044.1 hypothetical protein P170DRAFT_513118 [Aspergillus steynii IBT 23096]